LAMNENNFVGEKIDVQDPMNVKGMAMTAFVASPRVLVPKTVNMELMTTTNYTLSVPLATSTTVAALTRILITTNGLGPSINTHLYDEANGCVFMSPTATNSEAYLSTIGNISVISPEWANPDKNNDKDRGMFLFILLGCVVLAIVIAIASAIWKAIGDTVEHNRREKRYAAEEKEDEKNRLDIKAAEEAKVKEVERAKRRKLISAWILTLGSWPDVYGISDRINTLKETTDEIRERVRVKFPGGYASEFALIYTLIDNITKLNDELQLLGEGNDKTTAVKVRRYITKIEEQLKFLYTSALGRIEEQLDNELTTLDKMTHK